MRTCTVLRSLAALALAFALAAPPRPAQAIWCENCSTVWNQLTSYAEQAKQLEQQVQSYQLQLQQYVNMVTNTTALPMQVWNTAQNDIMQVHSLTNASMLLGGNAGTFTQRLSNLSAYTGQLTSLTSMGNQYQMWGSVAAQNVSQMQAALGLSETQRATDANVANALDQQSQNAVGQMQAIQAGNRTATLTIAQLQKLQGLIQVQIQMELDHQTVESDRQALRDAGMMKFMSAPVPQSTGIGY